MCQSFAQKSAPIFKVNNYVEHFLDIVTLLPSTKFVSPMPKSRKEDFK